MRYLSNHQLQRKIGFFMIALVFLMPLFSCQAQLTQTAQQAETATDFPPISQPDPPLTLDELNWTLLQPALDLALAELETQLQTIDWGENQRVLVSLNPSPETTQDYPLAIIYLRSKVYAQLASVPGLQIVEVVEDNLAELDSETLGQLGRTLKVDAILMIDNFKIHVFPLEYRLPSKESFQGEFSVRFYPELFEIGSGHWIWFGDLIIETQEGNVEFDTPKIVVERTPKDDSLPLVFEKPFLHFKSLGIEHREVVWSPDSQQLLFWSGGYEELDDYPELVGNVWLADLAGGEYQLTHQSHGASPQNYMFLPDGDQVVFTTSNYFLRTTDIYGNPLFSINTQNFWISDLLPIPGYQTLVAVTGGRRSSEDHPDGIWVFDLESQTAHPFADLFNKGQPLVNLIREQFVLGSEFISLDIHISFSRDGKSMIFSSSQLPSGTTYLWEQTFFQFRLDTRELFLIGTALPSSGRTSQTFSPNADRAAVAKLIDGNCILNIIIPQEDRVDVNSSGCVHTLAWSPDGNWIAYGFYSEPEELIGIWLVSAEGREPVQIPGFAAERIGGLAWSPDGRYLAVTARISGEGGLWLIPIKEGN